MSKPNSQYRAARRPKMIAKAKEHRQRLRETALAGRVSHLPRSDGKNRARECARRIRQRAALSAKAA